MPGGRQAAALIARHPQEYLEGSVSIGQMLHPMEIDWSAAI
jgi:hypothetical protein